MPRFKTSVVIHFFIAILCACASDEERRAVLSGAAIGASVGAIAGGISGNQSPKSDLTCAAACREKVIVDSRETCVKFPSAIAQACMKNSWATRPSGYYYRANVVSRSIAVVPVFFATDRIKDADGSFGLTRASTINYGFLQVNIPLGHEFAKIEQPSWISFRRPEPGKDVMVLSTTSMSSDEFFLSLSGRIHDSPRKSLLLFVHGFRVSFADAARRTAQMAYDLQFDGASVFFSWPSQDQLWDYTVDEQAIVNSEPHLTQFLRDLLKQTDADNIYLIAHSMGTRGLAQALLDTAKVDPAGIKRIKEIVLAAPDIDSTQFTEQIAPGLLRLGAPITLYVSSNDRALEKSKQLHGGDRAGQAGQKMVLLDGIETIDVSQLNTDFFGHSYYGDQTSVLADLHYLIAGDLHASKRCCLIGRPTANAPKYWIFMK